MTYVDNPYNRRLGRVGKPYGTHVVHNDGSMTIVDLSSGVASSSPPGGSISQPMRFGQTPSVGVGQPDRPPVNHTDGAVTESQSFFFQTPIKPIPSFTSASQSIVSQTPVTTAQNNPPPQHHTCPSPLLAPPATPHSAHSPPLSPYCAYHPPTTPYCVHYPPTTHHPACHITPYPAHCLNSSPHSPRAYQIEKRLLHEKLREISEILCNLDLRDHDQPGIDKVPRRSQVPEEDWEKGDITSSTDHSKFIIPRSEIDLQEEIGKGGFGEVYAGLWKKTQIAFKKLLYQQNITAKKKKQLVNEIRIFSQLSHTNIVKIFGVVTAESSVGIVMEYLPKTLFHAIFIEEIEFTCTDKRKLLSEVISATAYLHSSHIAHCNIKCQNVLLDARNVAMLCDFGLRTIKKLVTTASFVSASCYSAPEVLRGQFLQLDELKMTDVYSLSLVIYQVLAEQEPFDDLDYHQLIKYVGEGNLRPTLDGTDVTKPVKELLAKGWAKEAAQRPDICKFSQAWSKIDRVLVN